MIDWRLLFIGYLIFAVSSYLLRRQMAKKYSDRGRLVNAVFFLCILYPTGLLVAAVTRPDLDIGWLNLLFIVVGSGVFPLITILSYKANKYVDAGQYALIGNLAPIISIVVAFALLNEQLTIAQSLGALVILVSAFIASATKKAGRFTLSKGVGLTLASVALLGLATVFEKWMLGQVDYGAYLVYGWGAQALWMLILAINERKYLSLLKDPAFLRPTIMFGIASTFKGLLFVSTLFASNSASLVSASLGVLPVIVVIAAYFILKEKDHLPRRITAGILGAIGLAIIYIF